MTTERKHPPLAITIDGENSKDLDDAIWVERDGVGWAVTVVIANVCKVVHKGDHLDEGAFHRVATRYFANGNNPMLPRYMSEGSLSLLPDEPRNGMVISIKLDGNMTPVGLPVISDQPFSSFARFSYSDIPHILEHPSESSEGAKLILNMVRLAEGLMNRRREAGALAMYDLNKGWFTTEDGTLRQLKDTRETIGHIIVQEFMILANTELAKYAAHHEIPVLFRNHTAKAHAPNRMEIVTQLELALKHPVGGMDVLRDRMNMTMNKADYGAELKGHYGLNLPAYLHCTSPIRRFVDLVNQRQFIRHAKGKSLTYTREEIQAIADHVNAKIAADLDATTDYFKERAVAAVTKTFTAGNLSALDQIGFERLVKTVVRNGCNFTDDAAKDWETFFTAVNNRLTDGRIGLLDIYFLLFESPAEGEWIDLHKIVIEYLDANPSKAASVASVAMNVAHWSEVAHETRRAGADHAPTFSARAFVTVKGGYKKVGGWMSGPSMRVAKQRAIIDMFRSMLGVGLGSPDAPDAAPPELPAKAYVPMVGGDPVAVLQEYAQKNKFPLPEYMMRREGGPDHAPLFRCVCVLTAGKVGTSGVFMSKKDAKKDAAKELLAFLLGPTPTGQADPSPGTTANP